MSFSPSIAADRSKYGVKISRQEYPVGVAGVRLSLNEIARRIREGGRTPSMRQFAEMVVRQSMAPSVHTSNTDAAQLLLTYVIENVRYRSDPAFTEYTQSAPITLCINGAPMCIPVGDCDDLVVALGSLLMAYGIVVRVVKQTFGAADQEHVLVEFQDEGGSWIAADPTPRSPSLSVGQKAVASHEDYVDPLNPASIGMVAGTPEAEFIGVGSINADPGSHGERRRIVNLVDGHYEEFAHGKMWQLVGNTWIEKRGTVCLGIVPNQGAAPASSFDKASTDLANQFTVVVAAGDTYMNASPPEFAAALSAYQAAGQAGVSNVGPEIDLSGASAVTQTYTQQAWALNKQLAALTVDDIASAQNVARKMGDLYAQAIAAGQAALAKGPAASGIVPAVDGGPTSALKAGLIAVGVGGVGGLLWAHYHRKPRRRSR